MTRLLLLIALAGCADLSDCNRIARQAYDAEVSRALQDAHFDRTGRADTSITVTPPPSATERQWYAAHCLTGNR